MYGVICTKGWTVAPTKSNKWMILLTDSYEYEDEAAAHLEKKMCLCKIDFNHSYFITVPLRQLKMSFAPAHGSKQTLVDLF